MFKSGQCNPRNVMGLRIIDHCPPHFTVITIDQHYYTADIQNWIYENLESRFCMITEITEQGKKLILGFERAAEASYFCLMLPEILEKNHHASF